MTSNVAKVKNASGRIGIFSIKIGVCIKERKLIDWCIPFHGVSQGYWCKVVARVKSMEPICYIYVLITGHKLIGCLAEMLPQSISHI